VHISAEIPRQDTRKEHHHEKNGVENPVGTHRGEDEAPQGDPGTDGAQEDRLFDHPGNALELRGGESEHPLRVELCAMV